MNNLNFFQMTWGDLFVSAGMDNITDYIPGVLDDAPKLKKMIARIKNDNPRIKDWVQKRPLLTGFVAPFE